MKGEIIMKILGEKSLSSKVIVGLNILFTIISLIVIFVLSLMIKSISHIVMREDIQSNLFQFILLLMIIFTGVIALFIIYQFIEIFKNLKSNILFCQNNVKSLDIVSNSCFIISSLYCMIAILTFLSINDDLIYYVFAFSFILMIIFVVSGIGIKILNEIYKKAIEYKEEHDFTI